MARRLNIVAILAMLIPLCVSVWSQVLIWLIPNCVVQMYGDQQCFVGSLNLGPSLLIAGIGGIYFVILFAALVSLPLFVLAAVLTWRANRHAAANADNQRA